MIYVSSPYTHESRSVQDVRRIASCIYVAQLLQQGTIAFSPVGHGAIVEQDSGETFAWDKWMLHSLHVLSHCVAVHVLKVEGWHQSGGVLREIEEAGRLKIPLTFIDAALLELPAA